MNAKEKEQFLDNWSKTRERGAPFYIVLTAIVWGTVTVIVARLIMTLLDQGLTMAAVKSAYLSRDFLIYWGGFLIGGFLYALTMWYYFNWQYKKIKAEHDLAKEVK